MCRDRGATRGGVAAPHQQLMDRSGLTADHAIDGPDGRGFSGGMRDMYEAILKFGSMIVEKLVGYKQPVLS